MIQGGPVGPRRAEGQTRTPPPSTTRRWPVVFPRWRDERFPLFVVYPSRHLPSAKVRAFLDFVIGFAKAAR